MLSHYEMIGRIAAAAMLGGVIGLERDIHKRHVGLRTHLLVSMAAGTFMVISAHFVYFQGYGEHPPVEVDASRIAASVVSGIGFLAGGSILKSGLTIQGITTAAGLWLVTAIGLAAGAGMYEEAVAVTAMGLAALTIFRRFEDKNDRLVHRHVFLEFNGIPNATANLMEGMAKIGATVANFNYERKLADQSLTVEFDVRYPSSLGSEGFIRHLEGQEGLRKVQVSGMGAKG